MQPPAVSGLTRYSTRDIVADALGISERNTAHGNKLGHNPSWIKAAEVDDAVARLTADGKWFSKDQLDNMDSNIMSMHNEITDLQAEVTRLREERDEARKDADYHHDCRPNRNQAEAAMADAKALADWRADVTVALGRAGGTFFEDVPKLIREMVTTLRDVRIALNDHGSDDIVELARVAMSEAAISRLEVASLRATLAATEEKQ